MKFLIISHVEHTQKDNKIYGYGPYIREMNLWIKNINSVEVLATLTHRKIDKIDLSYQHQNIKFTKLPIFNLTSGKEIVKIIYTYVVQVM